MVVSNGLPEGYGLPLFPISRLAAEVGACECRYLRPHQPNFSVRIQACGTDSPRVDKRSLFGVVEDDAEAVTLAGAQAADTVAHVHPVVAALALHGTLLVREDQHLALVEGNRFANRLCSRALGE